mmetsp:Transcript_40598/g.128028  ORF Transcript_40598/g.128028 Transcript_40598/m.128028 type:complete len:97 (-) Transcript_40598:234-524(-)
MPERTTRDYEERDLLGDGDFLGASVPTRPNVYLGLPDSGSDGSSSSSSSRPKSRGVSSRPRPQSARRGKAEGSKGGSEQVEPVEDYPEARGLVRKR